MPHLTLIYPAVGHRPGRRYIRTWQMQPLAMAALAGLTPPDWRIAFFDDRLETIDWTVDTDLVALSIETFTARRGYQIAARFRARGIPVVMGGYHATLQPGDALNHADAVCVGDAEDVWSQILGDAARGALQPRYAGNPVRPLAGCRYDRSIFRGKNYMPLTLVETGRGCPFRCRFCSITAFYDATHRRRPAAEIADELRRLHAREVFFVDDNFTGDGAAVHDLCAALRPLRLRWVTQASLAALRDPTVVAAMAGSGCAGLLVGFESLDPPTLDTMGKSGNRVPDYVPVLDSLRRHGIAMYGTFMSGYPGDAADAATRAVAFAQEQAMFLAAFNHVVPFPGTPLYAELAAAGRLLYPRWWMSRNYRFGQVPFRTGDGPPAELENRCIEARRRFYSLPSIARRSMDRCANTPTVRKAAVFWGLNLALRREVDQKSGLPLGDAEAPEHD